MKSYPYLIVGGGMTAAAAAKGIRSVDPEGPIGIIGDELHPPYNRPPLSKGLWKGKPLEKIWRKLPAEGVELVQGRRVVSVDPRAKRVLDDQGESYAYGKLLLATGGAPRRLPFGGESVIYFRTLDDYQKLREWTGKGKRFGVIGGGFIGAEIAAALRMNGEEVVMIFPENGISARAFPSDLSQFLNRYYQEQGVQVLAGQMVSDIVSGGGGVRIVTGPGGAVEVDHVIAGIGIRPNTGLAQEAGVAVEDGILVNECLETSQPDIYAAGDVALYFHPALGKRLRSEHEENANKMGLAAGKNMAGLGAPYQHLPAFYSDLFDLGYEAVGELDASLEVVADWEEPYRKGILYYQRGEQVRGVLLWNVWDQVDEARKLIGQPLSQEPIHYH